MKNDTSNDKMIITLEDLVEEFDKNYHLGMRAISAAAQTYVTAISKYGEKARVRFSMNFPEISRNTWKMLEDIGRNRLPPQAYMMSAGAVAKIKEAKIPKATMNKVAAHKVQVFNPQTKKSNDIQFTDLTESQADLLLNPKTHAIRTVEQQKRYLARQRTEVRIDDRHVPSSVTIASPKVGEEEKRVAPPAEQKPYVVLSDGILFKKSAKVTFAELRELLAKKERGEI